MLSYLRTGTPYALWADTPRGFAEDILGVATGPGSARARIRARFPAPVPALRCGPFTCGCGEESLPEG
ncbi:hypothetical protein [Streptomyces sp. NPDC051219]|uniref:hypothetical protein n=1 Tax=Streptomyces sp. NPDC051219 TaxID=3155283 RepID=UPI003427C267